MPKFRVYFDTVIHYSGMLVVEAPTEEEAFDVAHQSSQDWWDDLNPDHITDFNVTSVEGNDEKGEGACV